MLLFVKNSSAFKVVQTVFTSVYIIWCYQGNYMVVQKVGHNFGRLNFDKCLV